MLALIGRVLKRCVRRSFFEEKVVEPGAAAWRQSRSSFGNHGRSLLLHAAGVGLGARGFCAVHVQSVRKSHAAFPIFMNALAILAGLVVASNGAMLRLWGATMPLALWVVNLNHSQTRKSGLSAIAEVYAPAADQRMRKMFREILELKQSASCLNIVCKFLGVGGFSLVDAAHCSYFVGFLLCSTIFCERFFHHMFRLLGCNHGKPKVCCHHH